MKIKALTGIETSRHAVEDDEHGVPVIRQYPLVFSEGDVVDVDDKVARRLIDHGHASDDLNAETNLDRGRREAAQQQD